MAPIFDGGRRRDDIELQRGRVDEAAAQYRRTVLRRRTARTVLDKQYRAGLVGLLDAAGSGPATSGGSDGE